MKCDNCRVKNICKDYPDRTFLCPEPFLTVEARVAQESE